MGSKYTIHGKQLDNLPAREYQMNNVNIHFDDQNPVDLHIKPIQMNADLAHSKSEPVFYEPVSA